MWLICALASFILWGCADLFYKKSNRSDEPLSHLKTSIMVGLVMGIHAIITLAVKGISYDFRNLYIYLPVSLMYIGSMTVGYCGFRYLELSLASPVQNASGAVTCILLAIVLHRLPDLWSCVAVVLVTGGVFWLGLLERKTSEIQGAPSKYRTGAFALFLPVLYCVIDALGTFMDGYYLDDIAATPLVGVTEENFEIVANCSYELTFLAAALILFVYVRVIRGEKMIPRRQGNRFAAALLETAGQFTYVYAMSGNPVVAAPVIGSYCVCSAALARIFLKEKLTKKQYAAILLVLAGIVILGIVEGLES